MASDDLICEMATRGLRAEGEPGPGECPVPCQPLHSWCLGTALAKSPRTLHHFKHFDHPRFTEEETEGSRDVTHRGSGIAQQGSGKSWAAHSR